MFTTQRCHICNGQFSYQNKPTLDRINNKKGHSKDNVKPCCHYCNSAKANNDEDNAKLMIQLRKFALLNNLPMTLQDGDEEAYYIIRKGITGGLSNVHHRINIKGETSITHVALRSTSPEVGTEMIDIEDKHNMQTHCVGIDFNSLYPSAYSSFPHCENPYTNNRMYMPGKLITVLTNEADCHHAINNRKAKTLFIAEVKGRIKDTAQFINFPPIIRNIDVSVTPDVIGSTMYDYMKSHNFKTDYTVKKLTQTNYLKDFAPISTYNHLWFLIDRCGFEITEIRKVLIFTRHVAFEEFVTSFMKRRQEAIINKQNSKSNFYKLILNGSYGYDLMNTAKYANTKIVNAEKLFTLILSNRFMSAKKLCEDCFQVQLKSYYHKCNTCIQEGFFTLDNAKYWYLNFYYNFLVKAMDMNKIHVVELDTDSLYLAIAGDPNEDNTQGFKHVIQDETFYDANVDKWFPHEFCKKQFANDLEMMAFDKKLLGLAIEKQCDSMIALAPKLYCCFNGDDNIKSRKVKGVSLRQNNITINDYRRVTKGDIIQGANTLLQLKKGQMSRGQVLKNAITATHIKYQVLSDFSTCAPLNY
jgi:hypothetical protein